MNQGENMKDENYLPIKQELSQAETDQADVQISKGNRDNKTLHSHGKKHILHMLLCCGIPVLLIVMLPILGYKGVLLNLAPFICPVMMLVMMPMMMHGHKK
jgi:hypothetical protein